MKKFKYCFLVTLITLCVASTGSFAQTETVEEGPSFKTLSNTIFNRIDHFSGFGSFMLNFGSNNKDGYVLSGGGGAALINKTYFIGGFGMNGNINTIAETDAIKSVDLNYGGFWFGYIYNKDMLIHPTASLKLGWGSATVKRDGISDNIFALVPQVGAELNVFKWAKVELGLGYQLISGINLINVSASQFRKLQIGLELKFGWFK